MNIVPQDSSSPDIKRCSMCKQWKPTDTFYQNGTKLRSNCKDCFLQREKVKRALITALKPVLTYEEKYPDGKTCCTCKRVLPVASFPMKRKHLSSYCRTCTNAQKLHAKRTNPEKTKAANAAYREANRLALAERQRQWRLNHPEEYSAIHSKWKRNNHDSINACNNRRRAHLKANGGSYTVEEWQALKAKFGGRCLMCGRTDLNLCVDHVIPVSLGGLNTIENLQCLCFSCNSKKHRKVLDLRHGPYGIPA